MTSSPSPAPSIWFVGALPPPLNGQSACNGAMLGELRRRGGAVRIHDIGGTTATKLRGIWHAIWSVLVAGRKGDRAYLSIPGQAGVWLFVPLAVLLRLRGIGQFVHHHSFRPINLAPSRAMQTLVRAGGRGQRHILLSADMRRRFSNLYLGGESDRAMKLSNAYLFGGFRPDQASAARPARPVTLGHMSVLTREKGVGYLLDLFEMLATNRRDWRLVIAGPCADAELLNAITSAVAAHSGRIDYRGAVDGAEKERFFADIDMFVLPTTLVDEAEPLVMIESFNRGVDVVANDTGCIRDRIRTPSHLLSGDRKADAAQIEALVAANARDWTATRRDCIDHASAIRALATVEAGFVFDQILGAGPVFAIDATPVT